MKKIALLIALFSLLGIGIAFSDIKNIGLKIKTQEMLPHRISCIDIDSITFSNIGLDSIQYDSIVTQRIHTKDSILSYDIDSVRSVSFLDITSYNEIQEHFDSLSAFLNKIQAVGKPSDYVRDQVVNWLNQCPQVKIITPITDSYDILIEYHSGLQSYIGFHRAEEEDTKPQEVQSRGLFSDPDLFGKAINVSYVPDEELIPSQDILFWRGIDSYSEWGLGLSLAHAKIEYENILEVLEKVPFKANLYRPPVIGDLNSLAEDFNKYGIVIITDTHGIFLNGGFIAQNNGISDTWTSESLHFILPEFAFETNNKDVIRYWSSEKFNKYFTVSPDFFKLINLGSGICFNNYCYGNLVRLLLNGSEENPERVFVGYVGESKIEENRFKSKNYIEGMTKGLLHSDVINTINHSGVDEKIMTNESKQRFFSIHNYTFAYYTNDHAAQINTVLKGWNNLKQDEIKTFKVWYKDEIFEHPDETCNFVEHELKPGNRYVYLVNDKDDGKYEDNKDGFHALLASPISGTKGIYTYYTVGFEHNGIIYHGAVDSLMCITKEATKGEWIDMGLPSGTLWASHNAAEGVGFNTLKSLISKKIATKEQFEELFSDENTYKVSKNDQWLRLYSKHNGNILDFHFRCGGFMRFIGDLKLGKDDDGEYIYTNYSISTRSGYIKANKHIIPLDELELQFNGGFKIRCYAQDDNFAVRLVK